MMQVVKRVSTYVALALVAAWIAGPSCGLAQQPARPPAAPATAPVNANTPTGEPAAAVRPSPSDATPAAQPDVLPATPDSERRADLPHDLSPWGMFVSADWVVKVVMIGLAFASLVTWTVFLAKTIEVACARARASRAFAVIAAAPSLHGATRALTNRGGPAAFMARSAGEELGRSLPALDYAGDGGVKERVVSRLARIEAQAGRRLTRGTGLLATIGATAPFVGLFGTVWGIMNAFIGISQSQTTNLAVVAPGIAEALLTTAFGLVAAIPAVVIYNVFARAVTGYRQALADAAAGVERLVSLDLDFRKVPPGREAEASALAAE